MWCLPTTLVIFQASCWHCFQSRPAPNLPAGPVYHTPLSSYGGEEAPHNDSNMRAGLDLGSTFLYSGETPWGGRWTMLPTREAITENLAERLCWEAARRDGTRVARRL
jgi:hypothetical protein